MYMFVCKAENGPVDAGMPDHQLYCLEEIRKRTCCIFFLIPILAHAHASASEVSFWPVTAHIFVHICVHALRSEEIMES